MNIVLSAIMEEAERAAAKYGPPTSTQEALGVLLEEFDELKEAIHANSAPEIAHEAVQVAAVAYRLAMALDSGSTAFYRRSGLVSEAIEG